MSTLRSLPILIYLSILPISADTVVLNTGDSLTGKVQSMDSSVVRLDYPFAKAPLALKSSALKACIFEENTDQATETHTTSVTLVSGDKLAGNILNMNKDTLTLENTSIGHISIPRNTISSMILNLSNSKPVYTGPQNRKEWSESDEWSYEDGALISNGNGYIYSDLRLPDDFILKFTCSWEGSPQMKIHFCDPGLSAGTSADRYTFSINRSGMDLKRENSKGSGARYNTIAEIPRRMDKLKEKTVDIEFRVDRTKGVTFIFINGRPEGMHTDLFGDGPPRGSGVTIHSASNASAANHVSNIEVLTWDAVGAHQRNEKRSTIDKDSVIDSEGQLFTGDIESIRPEDGKLTVFLDSPFSRNGKTMPIPAKYLSTIFLALDTAPEDIIQKDEKFTLSLQENGILSVPSLTLTPETAEFTHPELGQLSLKRSSIRSITLAPEKEND